MPHFIELYGTEEKCEAALELMRWPDGFRCPRCNWQQYGFIHDRRHKHYQCRKCRHQSTLTASTIMETTMLHLTTWFLAFYLVGQAKTGISSLALMRHLGVNCRTAWLIHNKIMQAMSEQEDGFVLRGKVQVDDAYLGGEHCGGKPGRGSEKKFRSLQPSRLMMQAIHNMWIATLTTFSFAAIADRTQDALAPGCEVISDGLACYRAVAEVGCFH